MSDPRIDVIGIGNAIVDILVHADDDLLVSEGMTKGAMTLIDADEAKRLYEKTDGAIECSGGSAANTIVGLASLGGSGALLARFIMIEWAKSFETTFTQLGFPTIPCRR